MARCFAGRPAQPWRWPGRERVMVRLMTAMGRTPAATMVSAASAHSSRSSSDGELVDEGRERLEVERTHEEGERKLLHGVNEHEERRDEEARAHEREVDATKGRPGSRTEGAGRPVHTRSDPAEARVEGPIGERHEPGAVAQHESRDGAAQEQTPSTGRRGRGTTRPRNCRSRPGDRGGPPRAPLPVPRSPRWPPPPRRASRGGARAARRRQGRDRGWSSGRRRRRRAGGCCPRRRDTRVDAPRRETRRRSLRAPRPGARTRAAREAHTRRRRPRPPPARADTPEAPSPGVVVAWTRPR